MIQFDWLFQVPWVFRNNDGALLPKCSIAKLLEKLFMTSALGNPFVLNEQFPTFFFSRIFVTH